MLQTKLIASLTLASLSLLAVSAGAADVAVANLTIVAQGGTGATTAQKLALTGTKPESVKQEPAYRNTPLYGVIESGNAKDNKIAVVLDTSPTSIPHLYVDANGNGDLTDDPAVTLVASATAKPGTKTLTASVPVTTRYDIPGRAGTVTGNLVFTLKGKTLTFNREYTRVGTLTLNKRAYKVALVDQSLNGVFNGFQHGEGDDAKVTLLIDRNGDGKFDPETESYDASKPIKLSSGTYEVTNIDVRGTQLTLRRTGKAAISPSELAVGTEPIEFEAKTTNGQTVNFPGDYRGKLVLLDFWATWCPPCREEVPNIVATYNRYHEQGFEILGISLDQANKQSVLDQFTRQYNMTWQQVYDGGFWKAEIAQLYGIHSIPMSYLVDGDTGKIVSMGDDLRGQGLGQAVEQNLGRRKPQGL